MYLPAALHHDTPRSRRRHPLSFFARFLRARVRFSCASVFSIASFGTRNIVGRHNPSAPVQYPLYAWSWWWFHCCYETSVVRTQGRTQVVTDLDCQALQRTFPLREQLACIMV